MKILDKENISPEVKERVEEISKLPGVKEIVAFPDVHLKEKYTNLGYRIDVPSSLAILTENCLYPQFRSRGFNCGMALIKTNLFYENALLPKLEKVLLNFNKGLVKNLFNYFRFPLKDKYSLSAKEFKKACLEGSEAIREKFGLPQDSVFGQEFKFTEEELSKFNYSGINQVWQQGSLRLKRKIGIYFGGNHFLEFQVVDDVFDQEQAEKLGIKKGQICILFHTAGDSLDDILEILKETIYQPHFVKLEESSPNFPIILKAIKILMNYGFAYRLTTFAILNDLFAKVFGSETKLDYFIDHYHNSIEEIKKDENNTLFFYRHNVNKVSKDSPVILSGSYNLKSYVNKGMDGAENFLWSADHGYGDLIKKFPQEKINSLKVKRILFKKGINLPSFVKNEQRDIEYNPAANHLLSLFEENNISKRVFSLTPIINFKFI